MPLIAAARIILPVKYSVSIDGKLDGTRKGAIHRAAAVYLPDEFLYSLRRYWSGQGRPGKPH
ncbi:protein of unknown function [Denitratisoma oestradiolicum]|uniref:Uncharacterized protein n=1 Tax=Denitratisoma oestradiolicum TaxID=311182 RepID=A0A6S6XYB2_9PROT|nr:protein of unknown function [Denitratisoma oestradiolicum]